MTRWKRWKEKVFGLGLIMASFVMTIAVVEVVLRTTHVFNARLSWSAPDSLLGYRFAPGSRYWHNRENDHPISGKINSYGWRDRDWSLGKTHGVHRIAVVGDSFVEAIQVESDSTFLRHTERRLADTFGVQAELMNFGRSGYTQTHQVLIVENSLAPFAPDLVLLCFVPENDIADVRRETASHPGFPFFVESPDGGLILDTSFRDERSYRLKSRIDPLKRRSALLSLATQRYNMYLAARMQQHTMQQATPTASEQQISGFLSLCTKTPDPRFSESYRLSKRLIAIAAKRGFPVMLVCLTSTGYRIEDEQELRSIDPSFDPFFFETDLREFAATLGIHYLGLQTPFREESKQGTPLSWDHWNYAGHRLVAESLSRALAPILQTPE